MTQITMSTKKVRVPVYTYDGKEYLSREEAENAAKDVKKYHDFLTQQHYSTQKLFKNHNLDEVGYWVIEDEGPIDFSSSGSRKMLAVLHGRLDNVIRKAISIPGFWGYGPGKITKIDIENV